MTEIFRSIAAHGILPALEVIVHGLTPLSALTAFAVAMVTVTLELCARRASVASQDHGWPLPQILVLWVMACMSVCLWVACLIALHREGLV